MHELQRSHRRDEKQALSACRYLQKTKLNFERMALGNKPAVMSDSAKNTSNEPDSLARNEHKV